MEGGSEGLADFVPGMGVVLVHAFLTTGQPCPSPRGVRDAPGEDTLAKRLVVTRTLQGLSTADTRWNGKGQRWA